MSEVAQQMMASIALLPLVAISIIAFLGATGWLWRRSKTIEALLVWVSMWLYLIALILLFK
ncbi:hypothetical protein MUP01_01410 [Candidatus Bathyarchaeota archaeon]|nr:hypothetical protein [Candidatus Bathyarchaeota archaeon]